MNEDPAAVLANFAIWLAGMINPARLVAADAGVDHVLIFERKEKGVIRIGRVVRRKPLRFFPWNSFSSVFNDACSFADRPAGKHSFAMHA